MPVPAHLLFPPQMQHSGGPGYACVLQFQVLGSLLKCLFPCYILSSTCTALPCLLGACWKARTQSNIDVEARGYAAKLLLTPASHIDADEGAQQVQGTPNSGQVASAAPIQPVSRHGLVQMIQKPMSDQHACEEFYASPSIN